MKTIYHTAILFALTGLAVILFCAGGQDADNNLAWMIKEIGSKALMAVVIYITAKLYSRWRRTDVWIAKYDADCEERYNRRETL